MVRTCSVSDFTWWIEKFQPHFIKCAKTDSAWHPCYSHRNNSCHHFERTGTQIVPIPSTRTPSRISATFKNWTKGLTPCRALRLSFSNTRSVQLQKMTSLFSATMLNNWPSIRQLRWPAIVSLGGGLCPQFGFSSSHSRPIQRARPEAQSRWAP